MRRIIITLVASTAVLAAGPAVAVARHHSSHKSHARRHARIRHERFGSADPTTTASSPDNAGTVDSFSGGVLTITLNDGSTVMGKVTDATELECTSSSAPVGMDGDSGSGSGDSSSGDDNGGNSTTSSSGESSSTTTEDNDANENQTEANDANENQTEDNDANEDQNENAQSCTTSSLTHGTVVREAELNVSSSGATWHKVELITP